MAHTIHTPSLLCYQTRKIDYTLHEYDLVSVRSTFVVFIIYIIHIFEKSMDRSLCLLSKIKKLIF